MKLETELHASYFRLRLLAHLVALTTILAASPLQAQFMVLPVNLAYLTQRAGIIVQGRVTEVRHESLPGYPNIPTVEVTLQIENMVRGPAGSAYTFREILAEVRKMASHLEGHTLTLRMNPEVGKALKSREGVFISEMESLTHNDIINKGDPTVPQERFEIL